MATPTHGLLCQSWTYPTQCWYCRARIYVYQCSCGSAVLFDWLGSGLAHPRLRGASAFPPGPSFQTRNGSAGGSRKTWRRSSPVANSGLASGRKNTRRPRSDESWRPFRIHPARTKRIDSLDTEGPFELAAMKVGTGASSYAQVTLRDTDTTPHQGLCGNCEAERSPRWRVASERPARRDFRSARLPAGGVVRGGHRGATRARGKRGVKPRSANVPGRIVRGRTMLPLLRIATLPVMHQVSAFPACAALTVADGAGRTPAGIRGAGSACRAFRDARLVTLAEPASVAPTKRSSSKSQHSSGSGSNQWQRPGLDDEIAGTLAREIPLAIRSDPWRIRGSSRLADLADSNHLIACP